jgi:dienelactone hydrolase
MGSAVTLGMLLAGCNAPSAPSVAAGPTGPVSAGRFEVAIPGAGVNLGGVLFRPEGADARGAVIVVHGWLAPGTNGAATVEGRARRYADDGYVALALAMRGWPPSGGVDDCGLRQPDDLIRVVEWLREQPGVMADRVALVGFSQGGQVVLLAAARGARVRGVVAYYPVTDVDRWKQTTTNPDIPGYITAVCEPGGTAARSPLSRAADISPPILLVHGDLDTRVPTEQSVLLHGALAAAGRDAAITIVPGAQHGFTAAEEALARPAVDRFLSTHLR